MERNIADKMLGKQLRVLHPDPQSTGREPDWACYGLLNTASAQQGHICQSFSSFPNSALKRLSVRTHEHRRGILLHDTKTIFLLVLFTSHPKLKLQLSSLLCLIPMPLCSLLLLLLPLPLSHATSPVSHQDRSFTFTQNSVQIQDPIIRAGFLGPLLVLITLCGFSEKAEPEKRVSR